MKQFCYRIWLLAALTAPFFSRAQPCLKQADSIRISRGIPGLVYAVFTSDSILETGTLGVRTIRTNDSIQLNDLFNIGTNTTAFTAYVAARMVEAGKIKWTTRLLEVFPEFKKKAFPVYQKITLQDLLSSRTRITPFMSRDEWFSINVPAGPIISRRKSFTLLMLQHKPDMDNFLNDKIIFSLAGYVMAASMLEKISGRSWEDLVTQYVRKPLKISVNYSWPNKNDPAAPSGHWYQSNSFHAEDPDSWLNLNSILYPANDININIPDYIKFMQENLLGLAGKKAQLSESTFNFLHFGLIDYALGWNNGSLNDYAYSFHEGLSLLFACRAELIREKNLGIIVMCNSGDRDGRGAVVDVTRLLERCYLR